MSKQFWLFLLAGLGVVGALIAVLLVSTKSSHLELTGSILKVRVLALGSDASLAIVDFRVRNPSKVPFVVGNVAMQLDSASGQIREGVIASKVDIDNVFKYQKLVGEKFNDVLSLQDTVAPFQSVDRMTAARFNVPESVLDSRKALHLRLTDVDGTVADITETATTAR
jgi:hypothetical protein